MLLRFAARRGKGNDGHPSCPRVATRVLRPTFPCRWAICPAPQGCRMGRLALLRVEIAAFHVVPPLGGTTRLCGSPVTTYDRSIPSGMEIRSRLRRDAPRLSGYAAHGARTFLSPHSAGSDHPAALWPTFRLSKTRQLYHCLRFAAWPARRSARRFWVRGTWSIRHAANPSVR